MNPFNQMLYSVFCILLENNRPDIRYGIYGPNPDGGIDQKLKSLSVRSLLLLISRFRWFNMLLLVTSVAT